MKAVKGVAIWDDPMMRNRIIVTVLFFSMMSFVLVPSLWGRLSLELSGTVVSSTDRPSTGAPRYATYYIFRDANGSDFTYIAGATNATLERSMPVGTVIEKKKWEYTYLKNGRRTPNDLAGVAFGSAIIVVVFVVGVLGIGLRRRA